jgi:hypothetical protein
MMEGSDTEMPNQIMSETITAQKRRNAGKEGTVIFIHIPKTAGTTMNQIIERQYKPNAIFTINSKRMKSSIDRLKRLDRVSKSKIKLLRGHMSFGLHEFFFKPCTYITILRDPIDRIISHYYFVLNNPNHYLHNQVKSRNMSLKDYVSSGISTELDNAQTRSLSGYLSGSQNVDGDIGFGECSAEMLNKAKDNLKEYFSVIGLVDKFDETLIQLQKVFDWKLLFYNKMRVSKKRPASQELSKDVLRSIEKYNELDIDLYSYAKDIFQEQINHQGEDFVKELSKFKILNKRYGRLTYISTSPLYMLHRIFRFVRKY